MLNENVRLYFCSIHNQFVSNVEGCTNIFFNRFDFSVGLDSRGFVDEKLPHRGSTLAARQRTHQQLKIHPRRGGSSRFPVEFRRVTWSSIAEECRCSRASAIIRLRNPYGGSDNAYRDTGEGVGAISGKVQTTVFTTPMFSSSRIRRAVARFTLIAQREYAITRGR